MSIKYTTILTSLMTLNVDSFCMEVSQILIFKMADVLIQNSCYESQCFVALDCRFDQAIHLHNCQLTGSKTLVK